MTDFVHRATGCGFHPVGDEETFRSFTRDMTIRFLVSKDSPGRGLENGAEAGRNWRERDQVGSEHKSAGTKW